jgi:hypothetical protein
MQIAGHVLVNAPPDPDGQWIRRSVATVLKAEDSKELRGFRLQLFNSKGTHGVDSTGKTETELIAKYRGQAKDVGAVVFF